MTDKKEWRLLKNILISTIQIVEMTSSHLKPVCQKYFIVKGKTQKGIKKLPPASNGYYFNFRISKALLRLH